jgi:hypothetical protein
MNIYMMYFEIWFENNWVPYSEYKALRNLGTANLPRGFVTADTMIEAAAKAKDRLDRILQCIVLHDAGALGKGNIKLDPIYP